MKQALFILLFCLYFIQSSSGQSVARKILDHADFLTWKTIQGQQIAADGRHVLYRVVPGEGDPQLRIYDTRIKITRPINRVSKAGFDYDGGYMFGLLTPHRDSLRALERRKVEKKDWPSDTLFILSGISDPLMKIADVKEYKTPAKLGNWLAYTIKDEALQPDSLKGKKKSKKEILHLIVRELSSGTEDTLRNVKEFLWAEKAPVLIAITESRDSTERAGVAYWLDHQWTYIKQEKGDYSKLSITPEGNQVAFLGNLDTTKSQVPPWQLFYYDFKTDSAQSIASKNTTPLPLVSQHAEPRWSENGQYLFYGRAAMPWIRDTTLLDDEIIDVEIWGTQDPVLYTVQNVNKSAEEKRSYTWVYDTQTRQHTGIGSPSWENVTFAPDRNSRYVIVYTEKPYQKEATWIGETRKDLARVDLLTGVTLPVKRGLYTLPRLSPGGNYAYGYSEADSTWWACHLISGTFMLLDKSGLSPFYDELNDVPAHPSSYGSAGWIEGDQSLILNDRYDLWAWSPAENKAPLKLTNGREMQQTYRYIRTDPEEKSMSAVNPWLMYVMDQHSKSTGYTWFKPNGFVTDPVQLTAFEHSRQVTKSRKTEHYLFQKENFETFPDLQITSDAFASAEKISEANPQQQEYEWGSSRLYHWIDFDGVQRTGMLILPPGYDTLRSYPTIVNFYERSSDELHTHPTPAPHRSTINYAFYSSRGYVIFNPDISYKTGYPGESAYQIVVSGTTDLVKNRIADPDNLALQGHSWGGYQIAYILTRTNMFKCAEAGAAVVNMTSAYGGIRWGTGMARLFQYEKTQSRIGKTLWEDQNLYLQNSPLFRINKIESPLLLMHNDEDAAVPFEQGIEFYLALRRLDKTAWLLNYRGEPHWPTKWQNRKDFQVRMSQFFDHYLLGKPMPDWMAKGVPAVARGMTKN